MLTDISYKEYRKKNDIHGTVLYPATMVAPVQKDILSMLLKENTNIRSIFDPFHGSGTALFEGFELSENISLYGCDINPLANLITKVKLQGVGNDVGRDIETIKNIIKNTDNLEIYVFPNSKKWFRNDIAYDLSIIRSAIISIQNQKNRQYFWCMLSDIIRKYSNTRSSTYKLHMKTEEQIKRMPNHVINDFIISIENNMNLYKKSTDQFYLYKCDTLKKIKEFSDSSFDISITSPPYGDNGTTVPYGQFSMLSLYWIDNKDLDIEGWELDNYSKIDSNSIGGCYSSSTLDLYDNLLVETIIHKIKAPNKKEKVVRFFSDYFVFINELCRITDKYIVMTLGNRTVDNIRIDLTDITMKYLERRGFYQLQVAEREIINKRTPKMTSKVDNQPVNSMSNEFVIIFGKKLQEAS